MLSESADETYSRWHDSSKKLSIANIELVAEAACFADVIRMAAELMSEWPTERERPIAPVEQPILSLREQPPVL